MNLSFLQKYPVFFCISGTGKVTTQPVCCERLPEVLSELLLSIKAGKGWSVKLRSNSSSQKISGGLSQALLIQYLSERVSVKRYLKRVLEKF